MSASIYICINFSELFIYFLDILSHDKMCPLLVQGKTFPQVSWKLEHVSEAYQGRG